MGPWKLRLWLLGRSLVRLGCGYEIVALSTDLPTITVLVHRHRRTWPGRVIIGLLLVWLLHHLLVDG